MRFKINDLLIILAFLLIIIPSIRSTIAYEEQTAEDWNRHILWIERYIKGDFSPFYEYPPFFHLFMIPFVLTIPIIKYFQPILAFLTTLSISYVAYKLEGKFAMILVLYMLVSSFAYLQTSSALIPQALDYIIFSLIIYFLFEDKPIHVSIGLIFLLYNHLIGLFYYLTVIIYSICFKRNLLKYLAIVFIVSLPIFIIYYIPALEKLNIIKYPVQIEGNWSNDFRETKQIWLEPWAEFFSYPLHNYLFYSSFITWLLLPITIWQMKRQKRFDKKQFFYAVWTFTFIPLIIFQLWRATSFLIISFAFFQASVLRRLI